MIENLPRINFLWTVALIIIALFLPLAPTYAVSTSITATVKITVCGDSIVESPEECDSSSLNGASCTTQGFTGGTLSCSSACEFDTSSCTYGSSGGSGGGGGGIVSTPSTSAVFSGKAYPGSTVTLLKDAQIAATTIAGQDGKFQINLSGLSGGNYIFSLYSEDNEGMSSSPLTLLVSVMSGTTVNIAGILIAPTIVIDNSEFKREDGIATFGQSVPSSDITVDVNSKESYVYSPELVEITEIPPIAYSSEGFLVTGKTFPNAIVRVWLEGSPEPQNMSANVLASVESFIISLVRSHLRLHYHTAIAGADGNFVLKHPLIMPRDSGVYTVWAEVLDEEGSRSTLSSKQSVLIQKTPSILSKGDAIERLLFLALLVILGVIWLWRKKFLRFINKLRK